MEAISIVLDDGTGKDFDEAVHGPGVLTEGGDLKFVVKDGAMESGNPAVVVTFSVCMPNGNTRRAQAVTSAANLIGLGRVLEGRYPMLKPVPF